MAKKHHRKEHISVRRKREAAIKEQNRKHLTKKQKTQLWSVIGAVALVVLLFVAFYTPGDSVITWMGSPMFTAKDAMIAEIDDRYYDVGSWTAPEGYTYDETYDLKQDDNQFEAFYSNDTEGAQPVGIYVSVVPEKTVEEMRTNSLSVNDEVSEIMEYTDAKYPYNYFVSTLTHAEDSTQYQYMVAGYVQTNYDCMILFNLTSGYSAKEDLPAVEDMLACLPEVMEGLTLK